MNTHELSLLADATSVARARRYFSRVVTASGVPSSVRAAGTLAVSELVTNAVVHGKEPITLRITTLPRVVRVAVSDGSDHPPEPRSRRRGGAEHGRGLRIVADLAEQWGCEPRVQAPGKTVWCNLAMTA